LFHKGGKICCARDFDTRSLDKNKDHDGEIFFAPREK
jgi:hypothetical protein